MVRLGRHLQWAWLRSMTRAARLIPPLRRQPGDWDRRTYSEKLRWRCRHPAPSVDYRRWADKGEAKKVVQACMPVAQTYAVIRRPKAIASLDLPPTFVMKAAHGWNMSLFVQDGVMQGGNRSAEGAGLPADAESLGHLAQKWLDSKGEFRRQQRERHYAFVRPGILFEEYLGVIDHEVQLFLFRGQLGMAMVFYRSFRHGDSTHRLYDADWRLLEPGSEECEPLYERRAPPTPRPPQPLLKCLERICRTIDHVRVDLLVCARGYVFGEFTFTHAAGHAGYLGQYDAALGRHWTR